MRESELWLDPDGLLIFLNRLRSSGRGCARRSPSRCALPRSSRDTASPTSNFNCVVVVFVIVLNPADLVMGSRVIRLGANAQLKRGERFVETLELLVRVAEFEMRRGVV